MMTNEKFQVYENVTALMPEGFHLMSEQELAEHMPGNDPTRVGLFDPDRYIIMSFCQKKVGFFANAMADRKAARKRLETDFKKYNPSAVMDGDYDVQADGKPRYGFRYHYHTKDRDYETTSLSFLQDRTYMVLSITGYAEDKEETDRVREAFTGSIHFEK